MFSKYVAKFPYGYNPSEQQIKLLKEVEKISESERQKRIRKIFKKLDEIFY